MSAASSTNGYARDRGLGEEHAVTDRTHRAPAAYAERTHPLASASPDDGRRTGYNQPGPALQCSQDVAPHTLLPVPCVELRPTPPVGPGRAEHRPVPDPFALVDD